MKQFNTRLGWSSHPILVSARHVEAINIVSPHTRAHFKSPLSLSQAQDVPSEAPEEQSHKTMSEALMTSVRRYEGLCTTLVLAAFCG